MEKKFIYEKRILFDDTLKISLTQKIMLRQDKEGVVFAAADEFIDKLPINMRH